MPCNLGRCQPWASSGCAGGLARRSGKACVRRGGAGTEPSSRALGVSETALPAEIKLRVIRVGHSSSLPQLASFQNPVLFVLGLNSRRFLFLCLLCQRVMMPSRTNLATGIPSSKVKYSRLSSTDDGYIDLQGADRAIPVLIIGILVFLPGFYHLRIAYYASKGYRGYSYDDIPDFDD
ncbi:transmembrane protein 230 isoform X2 [Pongo pygmaeus]|uniref:transmembrane protein 230 isoform X2 n=1 Tax=Pongo pygmaeus TaxID=9600 RepID=UPI00300CD5CB